MSYDPDKTYDQLMLEAKQEYEQWLVDMRKRWYDAKARGKAVMKARAKTKRAKRD